MPKRNTKSQTSNLVRKLGISPIKPVASDQMKSTASGFQMKFNRMNVSNFVTRGSSSTSPGANYGNQSSVHSIAGKKVGTATQIPKITSTDGLESKGNDSLMNSLAKMFSFMQKSREDDIKRRDTERSFSEEKKTEEQRRHEQFLKILKEYTSIGTTTLQPTATTEEGGILGMIKSMIDDALKVFEWIKDLKSLVPYAARLLTFLSGPVGLALLGVGLVAAIAYEVKAEKEAIEANPYDPKYKDNAYAMKLRSEATSVGQAAEVNTRKATRQFKRNEIVDLVKSDLTDNELISSPGAPGADRPTLQKWLDENPKPTAMFQGNVAPIAGTPQTAIPAGGLPMVKPTVATPLPENVTPSSAGGGRGTINPEMATESTPTAVSVPPTPTTAAVNDVISKNADLVMEDSTSSGGSQPIIASSTSSSNSVEKEMPVSATQRDDTAIINRVFGRMRAGV